MDADLGLNHSGTKSQTVGEDRNRPVDFLLFILVSSRINRVVGGIPNSEF
jgi:hypothetical protein